MDTISDLQIKLCWFLDVHGTLGSNPLSGLGAGLRGGAHRPFPEAREAPPPVREAAACPSRPGSVL